MLSESELEHPNVKFCTELEQHMMVGAYDAVLLAAKKPPVSQYSFFLSSLMETVRINIAECAQSAYKSLSIDDASKMLMFNNNNDVIKFINDFYSLWEINQTNNTILLISKNMATKSEGIPNQKIINQVLTYATELERIV
mgnify:CR=1 FL=1